MTSSRYLIAHLAQAFGYFRRSQRMGDAASEMHLLREAEACLGAEIWQNVENIEALSVEYWNLRKLIKERDDVRDRLGVCQEKLDKAHEERSTLLNSVPEENQELLDKRLKILTELEDITLERDQVVAEAREVRRTYVGLKMKLEVLTKESAGEPDAAQKVNEVKTHLVELKSKFANLKTKRIGIGERIEVDDAKIDIVDEEIEVKRKERRAMASGAFQVIGDGNKEISILRAESGLLDTRMRQLFGEIGRYVSRHAKNDPACHAAAKKHHSLVDVMRALRRSIALNHRLAGTA